MVKKEDMENEGKKATNKLGFVSPDGYFQEISSLRSVDLEYVSKSMSELAAMLEENLADERYEKCAEIRDELRKRAVNQN